MNEKESTRISLGSTRQREAQIALQRRAREEGRVPEGCEIETLAKFPKCFIGRVMMFNGCWIWMGPLNMHGYGKIGCESYANAHRASFACSIKPIPKGMFVCHKCDIPSCINPEHLFLGSPSDNSKDMKLKGRHCFGEKNGRSKITSSQAIQIFKSKDQYKIIASSFGISISMVRRIKERIAWAHILPKGGGTYREINNFHKIPCRKAKVSNS